MIDKMKDEPVVIAALAVAVIVLGVDLDHLSATVQKVLDLAVILGGAALARQKVTPEHRALDREVDAYAKGVAINPHRNV